MEASSPAAERLRLTDPKLTDGVAFGSGHAAVIRRDLASTALLGYGVG
jgi:hypothetical protein